jgi:NTE family protein
MNTAPGTADRALVLGGGGSAGNAWLIGVVAGLFKCGLDVTAADLVIGTSAGATAAAQLTSAAPDRLLADIQAAAGPEPRAAVGRPGNARARAGSTDPLERTARIIAAAESVSDMRRSMGAAAIELAATSDPSTRTRWRAMVAARLPSQDWPERTLRITAVDAASGDPVVFDRHSGVDLVDAVAASCASGFAYMVGDRSYIDGGYRTNADNADLAAGFGRVLVLSPFGGRSRTPADWGTHLSTQVDGLRAAGSRVQTVFPDSSSRIAFGDNMMDLSRRPLVAQAGYEQAATLAGELSRFWR